MSAKTDVARIYDTVFSIPGMNDHVNIALNIHLKNVLLLSKIIERGLSAKGADDQSNNVLDIVPPKTLQELKALPADLPGKAGLTEMNQKLQSL